MSAWLDRASSMLATARLLVACRGRSRSPAAALAAVQEARLRALVAHAYERVPFHRRRLDAAGVTPAAVRTLADLPRIPTTPKAALRSRPAAELVARGTDARRCDVVRTSGSTGAPLRVYRGAYEIAWHRVAALRILRELGFRWTDRTLEIRALFGPTFAVQRLGLAPKRWVSILDPPAEQLRALVAYRPHVLCAAATTLHGLADAALAAAARVPPPRLVVSDSETLTAATRAVVARAFGTPPVDVYGLVELSNFAWECERRRGLHVSADTHLVEVLADDGAPAPPGAVGRIVCTDLIARTMPMLRYETGDHGVLAPDPCPCGRTFPVLARVLGRAGDVVLLPDGRRLEWPYFHETFARYDDLDRYQVVQEDARRLRVRLRVASGRWASVVERLAAELRARVPATVALEFEPWDASAPAAEEKFRPVVSRLHAPPEEEA